MSDITYSAPSEFGILVPEETGIHWRKQGGGMSCIQRTLEGIYLPIGRLKHNLGYPDWQPEGPEFGEKITAIDVNEDIPEEDYNRLPDHIKERGHFRDHEEYFGWIEETEVYGWLELWDDLYRFTYGIFDLLDSDPRNRWDDEEDLWDAIDNTFSFTYENVTYDWDDKPEVQFNLDNYPGTEPAIRMIRITGSKTNRDGGLVAEWAEEYKGRVVFLLCPNAD